MKMNNNQKVFKTLQFKVFSENECQRICSAVLEVLEHTGVRIQRKVGDKNAARN